MTNKTNQILVDTIQADRSLFLKFALKQCNNREIAEDLIQSTLCKFLSIPVRTEVKSPRRFICATIIQMYKNYRTVNKKYVMLGDIHGPTDQFFVDKIFNEGKTCTYEGDFIDSFTFKEISKEINLLPEAQRQAIKKDGEGFSRNENTMRANRRLGLLKLKEKFGGNDGNF